MRPFASILAATDFSAPSRHAVARALRLAGEHSAHCTVMYALELDALDSLAGVLGDGIPAMKQKLELNAATALRQIIDHYRSGQDATVDGHIVSGRVLDSILDHAATLDADLLVLGARGESFLRHALLGSTASRVLRKSNKRPVLVVKQPPHEPYRRLLIPVDFSSASLTAIRLARQLVPTADLVLLHAFELPYEGKLAFAGVEDQVIQQLIQAEREKCRQRLHQVAATAGLTARDYVPLIRHGVVSQHILTEEQEQDCDLIVLGKHGTALTEELLLGSVTKHVLAESQGDVLAVTDSGRVDLIDQED